MVGTGPVGFVWADVGAGTNISAGVTNGSLLNASLTINSVPLTWNNDTLSLTVTNAYGSINVTVALTVLTNGPVITVDLPPFVQEVSTHAYNYSVSLVGPQPYSYQWYANGTGISGATGATLPIVAGAPGTSTNFFLVASNIFGAVTSSVSLFNSRSTNSYAGVVLSLNPVGYWPLQETNPAAPVTIETNYGTLGVLGNAYYSFTNGPAGQSGLVTLEESGATGDGDFECAVLRPKHQLCPRAARHARSHRQAALQHGMLD